jgi:protein Tex
LTTDQQDIVQGQDSHIDQMEVHILQTIQRSLDIDTGRVQKTIRLLNEGNTVPFIARYRKEATGGLDEEQIRAVEEKWQYLRQLWQRKEEVIRLINEQGKLTAELKASILQSEKLQEVEDYYRPYKPKRRTRATMAKEKGLEPLAAWLLQFRPVSPEEEAAAYLSAENEVHSVQDALQGALDIIAEQVADDAEVRKRLRLKTYQTSVITTRLRKGAEDPKRTYEQYYEYGEAVRRIVPHRVLAINRGEKEKVLKVGIEAPRDEMVSYLEQRWIGRSTGPSVKWVAEALADAYKRLIAPSIERDIRNEISEKADEQAIEVFSRNLRALLLQPPVQGKTVLGIDPAYRTGCKWAVVDSTGKKLDIGVMYPTPPRNQVQEATREVERLIEQYGVNMIAIGNGTASRETERFVAGVIRERKESIAFMIVNEAGASVYSASKLAKEEFPDLDVAERSAVSIARRLQDPLSELVKIDPKSIGVGQYQHDVSQSRLSESLTFVVETTVNQVGVDVNTASVSLLQYVAGLNKAVATRIVEQREQQGRFTNRRQLMSVPRLGAKTYEQAIGFLRIYGEEHPFDATPIHPESYEEAERFIVELGFAKTDIGTKELVRSLQQEQDHLDVWSERLSVGLPTLRDIAAAFMQPFRDPRDESAKPLLKHDVLELDDLHAGMQLEGTVRNVVDFGAFVDIGLKNDGLVHISQLSRQFVKHPLDFVTVGDIVTVWIRDIDVEKERVGLTLIDPESK